MKMHSPRFKDPLITEPYPVTLMTPVIEETLRCAGIQSDRDPILERFMHGHPRIAIVHGSEDHPPNFGSKDTIRRMVRHIWGCGGLPFDVSQAIPCEEISQGHDGMHYALLSRNLCAAGLSAQLEVQGYDAAVVLGICDKMVVGNLRALIETDLARQRRKARPIVAVFIPSVIFRDAFVMEEDRRKFEPLRQKLSDTERAELDELLERPLKSCVYAEMKFLLDRCYHRRILQEGERDGLEHVMAKCTSVPGANCAASETSIIHRLMLAAFGIVPQHLEIAVKPPSDEILSDIVSRLVQALQKRERRVSISNLVRENLYNAAAVWSATGGHPVWLLHLTYLADALGQKLSTGDIAKRTSAIPQILAIRESAGHSVYSLATETDGGGNSGIDTIMRTLAEKRLIEDRTPTFDGPWMHRIMDARSANGNFLCSTMTPFSPTCGVVGVRGNLCTSAVARLGWRSRNELDPFSKKIYLAIYYLGQAELNADIMTPDGILDRLKRKVTREDLYSTWLFNWNTDNQPPSELSEWSKSQLWDYLTRENLLRTMVVVAGQGPHASGMPELHSGIALFNHGNFVKETSILVTDGRVSFKYDGTSIAHVVPEAMDGGGLAAVRTGDWVCLDLRRGELHVVAHEPDGHGAHRILSQKELLARPDLQKRVHELQRARLSLLPSFSAVLDQVSSADRGMSPSR